MRPIKFRAWDGRMKLVKELKFGRANEITVYTKNSGGHFEIMQFTGLKDKNGKEIYEGDIVRVSDNLKKKILIRKHPEIIVFEEGSFWTETTNKDCPEISKQQFIADEEKVIEVIGNIYENPELLEKK